MSVNNSVSASQDYDSSGFSSFDETVLGSVYDVPLEISVVLGEASMTIQDIISLKNGDIIELDRLLGEDVDVFINQRIVAKGEVVLVDENIGITMTEIII